MNTLRLSSRLLLSLSFTLSCMLTLLLTPLLYTSPLHAACVPLCKHKDGSLDIIFGGNGNGKTTTDFGSNLDSAQGVVVLPCGNIVAAGFTMMGAGNNFNYALAGYTPYGVLNQSFGPNGTGKVITDITQVLFDAGVPVSIPGMSGAFASALQKKCLPCNTNCSDTCTNLCGAPCNIYIAGTAEATTTPGQRIFTLARYTCNGLLDTTFGINNSGVTVTAVGTIEDQATAIALQDDGKIILGGYTSITPTIKQFAVVRYNCDGTIDTTFGCNKNGIVVIDFNTPVSAVQAIQIQKNGKIVVGGIAGDEPSLFAGPFDFALARLNPNGTLDRSFGTNGKVITNFATVFEMSGDSDDRINGIALLEQCNSGCGCADNETIVAIGFSSINDPLNGSRDFALAGYKNNGQLDKDFGPNGNGLVTTTIVPGCDDGAFTGILQHNCAGTCNILAAGTANQANDLGNFALVSYNTDGSLNTSFGINGIVTTDFNHDEDSILALAIQKNGYIIAAGRSNLTPNPNGTGDFALARYTICQPCCPERQN